MGFTPVERWVARIVPQRSLHIFSHLSAALRATTMRPRSSGFWEMSDTPADRSAASVSGSIRVVVMVIPSLVAVTSNVRVPIRTTAMRVAGQQR